MSLKLSAACIVILAATLGFAVPVSAQPYTEAIVYVFTGGSDGANPQGSVIQAPDGNLYGTTRWGGSNNGGTVFRISNFTVSPTEIVIYSFPAATDPAGNLASVFQASDGNLYGTTYFLGSSNAGTVFKISNPTISPTFSLIHSFTGGNDGSKPRGSLIQASDGNLYGTTSQGGANNLGTVFKISNPTTAPTESVIYSFGGIANSPAGPEGLIQASDGSLYGTTNVGGPANTGTVFKISNPTTAPTGSVIYNFGGVANDGSHPKAALIQAFDGNLYGTTREGGSNPCFGSGCGTVFKISNPTTSSTESVIYSFAGGNDGKLPEAPLIQAPDGSLYGTTSYGGSGVYGTVFKISNPTTSPTESVIYSFTGRTDGAGPQGLVQASDGNLYGTTESAGPPGGQGVVFRIGGIVNGGGAPPTNVVATATAPTTINVTWTAATGVASYRVYQSGDRVNYTLLGSTTTTSFSDNTAVSNTAYLYKVRSFSGSESGDSNIDLATAIIFTDPTLTAGTTTVKLLHFTELLNAVNAVRTLAGLGALAFTAPTPTTSVTVRRQHLLDLRSGIDATRSPLGLAALTYTDPTIIAGSTMIKVAHIAEVRNGVK